MKKQTGGWFKLYRHLLHKDVLSNEVSLRVYLYLASCAVGRDRQMYSGGECIFLKKGQGIFSHRKLGELKGLTKSKAGTALKRLQKMGLIQVCANSTKHSVVTILGDE